MADVQPTEDVHGGRWRRLADSGRNDHQIQRYDFELTCDVCGSLHPDTFMDWARRGGEIKPTDKNYKAYIECPDPDPRDGENGVIISDYSHRELWYGYSTTCKFYFEHLSQEQREEFVRLCNEGKLRFAEPGYLYRLPFFMSRHR